MPPQSRAFLGVDMCTVGSSESLRLLSSSQQNPGWGLGMLGNKNGCGGLNQIIKPRGIERFNVFVQENGDESLNSQQYKR